jgi:hypothetical protein
MVCRRTGQTNNDTMLCTAGNAPGAAQTGVLLRGNPAAATISLFVAQGGGVSFAINGAAVGSITVNNTSVVWYALDASAYVTGVNTTDGASGAPAVAVASGNSTGNLIVGNGTSTNPFQGHFCDVVAYNYKLSVAAIHLVVTALQAKWGST